MRVNTYECDACGVQKQKANHWWIIEIGNTGVLSLSRWGDLDAEDEGVAHLCGEACVQKQISAFMGAKA